MTSRLPVIGVPYYRVTWSDPDFTIPGVQPFIFVGTNITDDDTSDTLRHYFQDTISYFWCGSVVGPEPMKKHEDIEPYLESCDADKFETQFFSLDEVVLQLVEAQNRVKARTPEQ